MENFKEWLSDNLRYFMLGGAILVIVAVLFFGIRACVGSGKGASDEDQKTVQDNSQGNDPSSPEEAYQMIGDAFALSEQLGTPVLLRPTTRICHGCVSLPIE